MGQLEKYGLYVLVVVIVLILGVAIWGGEPPVPRGDLAAMSTRTDGDPQDGVRRPGRFDRIDREDPFVNEVPANRGGTDDPEAGLGGGRDTTPSPRFREVDDGADAGGSAGAGSGSGGGLLSPTNLLPNDGGNGGGETVTPPGPERLPPAPRQTEHVLRDGETLGDVARQYLGNANRWQDIARWNGIEDDRRIRAGKRLVIKLEPAAADGAQGQAREADAPRPVTPGAAREYVVRSGDSLSKIAERELGSQRHADALKAANGLDSDLIRVGQKLVIPTLAASGARD